MNDGARTRQQRIEQGLMVVVDEEMFLGFF